MSPPGRKATTRRAWWPRRCAAGDAQRLTGTIAVGDRLWAVFLLRLQAALPRATFSHGRARCWPPLRLVKDAAEVAALRRRRRPGRRRVRRLAAIALQRPDRARRRGRHRRAIARRGLAAQWGPIVGSGPNGASPHHTASDRVIQPGDLVVLDFGGRWTATMPT